MADLCSTRTVSISRAVHTTSPTKGSRMVETAYASGIKATIQPKRDRNLSPQNYPGAVSTTSADSMTTWKVILVGFHTPVEKGDIITDDLGTKYVVELPYANPFGTLIEARITNP